MEDVSWQEFEKIARKEIEKKLGLKLPNCKVKIGRNYYKEFDLVNESQKIVGDIKHYKTTVGGNIPSGKFSTLNEYVWLMECLEKFDGKEWKKLFVIGEDYKMLEQYIRKFDNLLGSVEFYFFSRKDGCRQIR